MVFKQLTASSNVIFVNIVDRVVIHICLETSRRVTAKTHTKDVQTYRMPRLMAAARFRKFTTPRLHADIRYIIDAARLLQHTCISLTSKCSRYHSISRVTQDLHTDI